MSRVTYKTRNAYLSLYFTYIHNGDIRKQEENIKESNSDSTSNSNVLVQQFSYRIN